ncbi:hypothetical protein HAPG_00069 [Halorubrum phage GNf2]|nr:hypothetical protein HAPG_00069 [Halorubrum phage GNf2]
MEADLQIRDTRTGETFPAAVLDGSIVEHSGDTFASVIPTTGEGRGGVVKLPDELETRV